MSLRRQLLTSQKVGHIAVFVALALAKESSTVGCSWYIITQLYLWPSCCSVALIVQVLRCTAHVLMSWMGNGWTAGVHIALQQLSCC